MFTLHSYYIELVIIVIIYSKNVLINWWLILHDTGNSKPWFMAIIQLKPFYYLRKNGLLSRYVPPKLPVSKGNISTEERELVSRGLENFVCPCNYPSVDYTMVWWTKAWNFIVPTLSHYTWASITLIGPLQDHLKHDWWRLKAQKCHSHVAIRWTLEGPVSLSLC